MLIVASMKINGKKIFLYHEFAVKEIGVLYFFYEPLKIYSPLTNEGFSLSSIYKEYIWHVGEFIE